jgi:hypothetical protein
VQQDDGITHELLTDERGELAVALPAGVRAEVGVPAGSQGRFPSLIGYQPMQSGRGISGDDPSCAAGTTCDEVYVLVASDA